jgi:two-component system, OmpR family, alkaline phosphatase synthesis response regulator PhoP
MSEKRKQTILVVEDDASLRMALTENLKSAGYAVHTAADGPTGLAEARARKPDLIVLDIMLPEMSGYEICRTLRDQGVGTPILMLTARQDEFDKLHGFEMGADDYVTKPFSIRELLARIQALLLRGGRAAERGATQAFGDCELDMDARVLRRRHPQGKGRQAGSSAARKRTAHGETEARSANADEETWEELTLTRTEFDLLAYFLANAGKALSRDQVMNDVWGTEYYGTQRSLDSFVAALRAKIERDPPHPRHIRTVHGVGYKFFRDPELKA